MRVPDKRWPNNLLETSVDGIDKDLSHGRCKREAAELAKDVINFSTVQKRLSPEEVAILIGDWVYKVHGENSDQNYFVKPIEHELSGKEGKVLAKGYIGIRIIEHLISDGTLQKESIECPKCHDKISLHDVLNGTD